MLSLATARRGVFALLLLWSTAAAAGAGAAAQYRGAGAFDYYVLALSWSPTYCGSRGDSDPVQCGSGRRYDFVVHGLWPQYVSGWPQFCDATPTPLPEALVDGMLDIMPSPQLVRHEWTKHGTCSGLAPEDYFALTRRLHDAIRIPARYIEPGETIEVALRQIVADFVATNRGLARDMMSVQCGNRRDLARLAELRFCFSRDGALIPCGDNERRQCRAERLVLPPVR